MQASAKLAQLETEEKVVPNTPKKAHDGVAVKGDYIGKKVYNEDGQKIGAVEDVILDAHGKMSKFVISVGGFLGMGTHNVAISLSMIRQEDGRLILYGYNKEQLKALPSAKL